MTNQVINTIQVAIDRHLVNISGLEKTISGLTKDFDGNDIDVLNRANRDLHAEKVAIKALKDLMSEMMELETPETPEEVQEIETPETPETPETDSEFSMTVVPAGKKFKYIDAQGEVARRSNNGEYTHVVYARDPKGAGNWFVYSFHGRRDLADKKASSLSYPSQLGQWETTTYQTKVVEVQQG